VRIEAGTIKGRIYVTLLIETSSSSQQEKARMLREA